MIAANLSSASWISSRRSKQIRSLPKPAIHQCVLPQPNGASRGKEHKSLSEDGAKAYKLQPCRPEDYRIEPQAKDWFVVCGPGGRVVYSSLGPVQILPALHG